MPEYVDCFCQYCGKHYLDSVETSICITCEDQITWAEQELKNNPPSFIVGVDEALEISDIVNDFLIEMGIKC